MQTPGLASAIGGAIAALLVLSSCRGKDAAHPSLHVAAAADLAFAFREIGTAFGKKTGAEPVFSFGSTGLLEKQIEEGGPFDVFAAANVSYADKAAAAGACDPATKALYARGRIVLWSSTKSPVARPAALADLADARFVKIAIANPDHAPYGKAAQQALEHEGLWDRVKPKIVFGENVQQTLEFAKTGNADAAVVALSLAIVAEDGAYVPIDPSLHAPIDQAMIVCKNGRGAELGRQFTEFVNGAEGRAIMTRYGFLLPGETVAHTR
jgi:molybdate transport system substrate-binding protein